MFVTEEVTSPHTTTAAAAVTTTNSINKMLDEENEGKKKKNQRDVGYYRYYRQFCSTNRLTPIKTPTENEWKCL